MGSKHRNHNTFDKELQECVDTALIVKDFEAEWKSVDNKHELDEHEHMKYLYKIRHEWVPVYFRDTFLCTHVCHTKK